MVRAKLECGLLVLYRLEGVGQIDPAEQPLGFEVDPLAFHAAPDSFDEHVIAPGATSVHRKFAAFAHSWHGPVFKALLAGSFVDEGLNRRSFGVDSRENRHLATQDFGHNARCDRFSLGSVRC